MASKTEWNLEEDNVFLRELKKGYGWQLWVAVQFLKEGFAVKVPPLEIRPNHDSIDDYTDHGDIIVLLGSRGAYFECKSRGLYFNSVLDYPHDTAFVDRVNTWRRKATKAVAILLVSRITGKIIVVPASTEKDWLREERFDRVRQYRREYYMAMRNSLRDWADLLAGLHRIGG
jgi:hypothetical protein